MYEGASRLNDEDGGEQDLLYPAHVCTVSSQELVITSQCTLNKFYLQNQEHEHTM